AVRRGCNAGARLFCDSHQPTLRSARAQHHHATGTLTNTPAPALDMTSQAVLAAQPKSAPEAGLTKVDPAAREARAEAPPQDKRVTQHNNYQQTTLFDRFSIKGY